MKTYRLTSALMLVAAVCVSSPMALADPLPGQFLKFQQLPLNNTLTPYYPTPLPGGAPYYGHDEFSTAYLQTAQPIYIGRFMADDFADRFATPVVHIRWWGSYMNEGFGTGVKRFLISFESDVPASPTNPFSHPGTPLLNQIVTLGPLAPGSGTFTEKLLTTPLMPNMPPLEALYEYNAELQKPFPQQRDTVYWLKIVALVDQQQDGNIQWGWHNRDWSITNPFASTPPAVVPGEGIVGTISDPAKEFSSPVWHFQDDAVSGSIVVNIDTAMPLMPTIQQTEFDDQFYIFPWDGPDNIGQFSKDLAFELYTIPEPCTIGLMCLAIVLLVVPRRFAR